MSKNQTKQTQQNKQQQAQQQVAASHTQNNQVDLAEIEELETMEEDFNKAPTVSQYGKLADGIYDVIVTESKFAKNKSNNWMLTLKYETATNQIAYQYVVLEPKPVSFDPVRTKRYNDSMARLRQTLFSLGYGDLTLGQLLQNPQELVDIVVKIKVTTTTSKSDGKDYTNYRILEILGAGRECLPQVAFNEGMNSASANASNDIEDDIPYR